MRSPGAQQLLFQALPKPPRQPSPRAKRLVFSYQGAQSIKLWLGGIFVVVGSVVSVALCSAIPSDLVISLSRVSATGQVLSQHVDGSTKVNGRSPTVVQFAYQVAGTHHEGVCSTTDEGVLATLAVGGEAQVAYSSLYPAWARLAGTTRSRFGYVGLFALLFPTIGLLLVVATWRENRREIRAFTWGRPIAARRLSFAEDRSTQMNGRSPWKLAWEFSVNGQTWTGSLSSMAREDLATYAESEQMPVLYLEEDPSVNVLYVA